MPEYRSRLPKPVMALGIVCIAFGISGLFRTIAEAGVFADNIPNLKASGMSPEEISQRQLIGIAGIVYQFLMLVTGISLIMFKPWGRRVALVFSAYAIGYGSTVVAIAIQQGGAFVGAILEVAIPLSIPVILLFVMMNPEIAAAFRRGSREAPQPE